MNRYKNIAIIIVIFVVAFAAYSYFFTGGGTNAVLTVQTVGTGSSAVDQDLISLLLQLKSITLDDSLFTNPAFQHLKDFSQNLTPEQSGRANPFVPFGSLSAPAASAGAPHSSAGKTP